MVTTAYARAIKLAECLCHGLTERDGVEPCLCGPYFGSEVPMDYCDGCDTGGCGQAWVRLVSVFPSAAFPNVAIDGTCSMPLAFTWEVGVARCAPTLDDHGNPPGLAEILQATGQQYDDMETMRQAIACCFGEDDIDYLLGIYTPLPTLGGCNASTWTVTSR